jgi:hypothetical protein
VEVASIRSDNFFTEAVSCKNGRQGQYSSRFRGISPSLKFTFLDAASFLDASSVLKKFFLLGLEEMTPRTEFFQQI